MRAVQVLIFGWVMMALPALAAAVDARWEASFAAFDAAERERAPTPGGVVFVGSSSIRLWPDLQARFAPVPVLQRGFGGSRLEDCATYVERLVNRHRPRLVVLYAGDNDLAEGRTPADVLASFDAFVAALHPSTRLVFVSIKPSPSRAALLEQARAANELIRRRTELQPERLAYVDVFTPMLDATGAPRADLFGADALHLNADGYALWQRLISAQIR